MSTTNTSLQARLAEARTLVRIEALVAQINTLLVEPSTRRFNRSTDERRHLWLELSDLASEQEDSTALAAVKRPKRKTKGEQQAELAPQEPTAVAS